MLFRSCGADLEAARLSAGSFRQSVFTEGNLTGAACANGDFELCLFHKARLRKADFHGSNLKNADFSYADLSEGDFTDTALHMAQFHRAVEEKTRYGTSKTTLLQAPDRDRITAELFTPRAKPRPGRDAR